MQTQTYKFGPDKRCYWILVSEPHSLASLSKTFCLYFTLLGDNKQGKDKEVLKKQIHLLVFENQPQCVKDKKMTRCRFVPFV